MSSGEQRIYKAKLAKAMEGTGKTYRLKRDADGWPFVPGKYGQIEYYGGSHLHVYAIGSRIIARLGRLDNTRLVQRGDDEARFSFRLAALSSVCDTIRARLKRKPAGQGFAKGHQPTPRRQLVETESPQTTPGGS